jgi:hypothetical protein
MTMWKYDSTDTEMSVAAVWAATNRSIPQSPTRDASHPASACSPTMPSARLATVMPSCAVAINRSCRIGSSRIRITRAALRLPAFALRRTAARGEPTIANSAATKKPLRRMRTVMRRKEITLALRPFRPLP